MDVGRTSEYFAETLVFTDDFSAGDAPRFAPVTFKATGAVADAVVAEAAQLPFGRINRDGRGGERSIEEETDEVDVSHQGVSLTVGRTGDAGVQLRPGEKPEDGFFEA